MTLPPAIIMFIIKIKNQAMRNIAIIATILLGCSIAIILCAKHTIHKNNKNAYYQYCIIMQSENISDDEKTAYAVAYMATTNMRELSDVERATIEHQVRIDTANKTINK